MQAVRVSLVLKTRDRSVPSERAARVGYGSSGSNENFVSWYGAQDSSDHVSGVSQARVPKRIVSFGRRFWAVQSWRSTFYPINRITRRTEF